jgi:hypothetical protein
MDLLPNTYAGGTVHTPTTRTKVFDFVRVQVGKDKQTTHLFAVGDKVYPSKIEVNLSKDSVTMGIVACDTCNKTDPTTYNKAQVVFEFPKGSLAKASAGEVEDVIGQLLAISSEDVQQVQAEQQGGDQGGNDQQGNGQGGGGQAQPDPDAEALLQRQQQADQTEQEASLGTLPFQNTALSGVSGDPTSGGSQPISAHARSFSTLLPSSWKTVNAIEPVGEVAYIGGGGDGGGKFGVFDITARTFSDLSNLLPPAWCQQITALAYGNDALMIGGQTPSRIGIYSPTSGNFQDMSSKLTDYRYGIHAIVFNGSQFLIAGAGYSTSLQLASAVTMQFTSLASRMRFYFAVNTSVPVGSSYLIAGAGPGPGPGQPPALGWVTADGGFINLTGSLPSGWGASWHSAYNGDVLFLQGFDRTSGAHQLLTLFDPTIRASTDVTAAFPTSFNLHSIDGGNGYFLIGGQLNDSAYLGRYAPGTRPAMLTRLLPSGAGNVTAVKITGATCILAETSQGGRVFIITIAHALPMAASRRNAHQDPAQTGAPGVTTSISESSSYTGCDGQSATEQLKFWVVSRNANTGVISVNGVDIRRPGTPFTWEWGDGTTTQGWFPQNHIYSAPRHNYKLRVISHEDDGSTDCAQLIVAITAPTPTATVAPGGLAHREGTAKVTAEAQCTGLGDPEVLAGPVALVPFELSQERHIRGNFSRKQARESGARRYSACDNRAALGTAGIDNVGQLPHRNWFTAGQSNERCCKNGLQMAQFGQCWCGWQTLGSAPDEESLCNGTIRRDRRTIGPFLEVTKEIPVYTDKSGL